MELFQVIVPKDDSWSAAEALGKLAAAHFVDLNKDEQPFNLPYTQRIKVCEETERRIQFLV
jgi:vacuolar-type H+-ATPase subunit I/STV1